MNQPISSLEQLSAQFIAWRSARPVGQTTPLSLRQQAVQLMTSYPKRLIITSLGINHSSLKRWSEGLTQDHRTRHQTPTTFVALPETEPVPDTANAADHSVLCELPNGVRLTINNTALTPELLSMLIQLKTVDGS